MENEEDECSEYHPHDTLRYCQFCLDQVNKHFINQQFIQYPFCTSILKKT